MVILGSQVKMAGTHQYREQKIRQEKVQVWRAQPEKSKAEKEMLEATKGHKAAETKDCQKGSLDGSVWQLPERDRQKVLVMMKILKLLTGKDFRLYLPDESKLPEAPAAPAEEHNVSASDLSWGTSVEVQEIYYESEKFSFSAQGTVQTADGKVTNFMVEVQLEREYYQETNLTIQQGNANMTDPLVINYRNKVASFTGQTFQFDLDGNGLPDHLPYLSPGSGYLAFDRNGDGTINDGNELFGPATGDGFAELAAYDEDQNGWIDEADGIFDRLKIWIKDSENDEKGSLLSLRQVGIGALLVEGLNTSFTYKNSTNKSIAKNRSTGVFLREDGAPGTIQQIDVIV